MNADISEMSADAEAAWRRRLTFRAWHRGLREADLLIGSFADRYVAGFSQEQLARFESILALSDPDLYNWITRREPVPAEHHHDVMALLVGFAVVQTTS